MKSNVQFHIHTVCGLQIQMTVYQVPVLMELLVLIRLTTMSVSVQLTVQDITVLSVSRFHKDIITTTDPGILAIKYQNLGPFTNFIFDAYIHKYR